MKDFLIEYSGVKTGLVCVILGACLSYIFFRKQGEDSFSATLFSEYQHAAQELSAILKDLLTLSLRHQAYSAKQCDEIDKALGVFFFKYYLILPQDVLEEINCLHECLLCGGRNTYIIKREQVIPVIQTRLSDKDIKDLLEEVALVSTRRSLFEIYQKNKRLPCSINLKCQARHVLTVMHDCWNLSNIHDWKKCLPKKTIAQRRNMH